MKTSNRFIAPLALVGALAFSTARAEETEKASVEKCEKCLTKDTAVLDGPTPTTVGSALSVPDVPLIDDNGNPVKFGDLTKGKIVAMSFIFTTCKTICPPIGANFSRLEKFVTEDSLQDKVSLVSVSIDPTTDTPQRLKDWKTKLGGGDGWTLLTGKKHDVDKLLKQLEVFTANKIDHSPWALIGNPATGEWRRENGLASADALRKSVAAMVAKAETGKAEAPAAPAPLGADSAAAKAAEKYFTNTVLIDHNGSPKRLYRDLMHDKIVVINSFFSACPGAWPDHDENLF